MNGENETKDKVSPFLLHEVRRTFQMISFCVQIHKWVVEYNLPLTSYYGVVYRDNSWVLFGRTVERRFGRIY